MWCGYPLSSKVFKRIDKTWRELKEERMEKPRPRLREEPITPAHHTEPPVQPAAPQPQPELESQPVIESESEPELVEDSVPQPSEEIISEPENNVDIVEETGIEPVSEVEPAIEPEQEPEATIEAETEIDSEPEPIPEPAPAPAPASTSDIVDITVDELVATYKENDAAAHERYVNKTIRITGIVDTSIVNDMTAVYQVILAGTLGEEFRKVECRFKPENSSDLQNMAVGDTVTIQGVYTGYVIHIIMRNCIIGS